MFPKAVEITQIDYEPTQMDILYAEGITSANGVASMEFSFPKSPLDWYMDSPDQTDSLIRSVNNVCSIVCNTHALGLMFMLSKPCSPMQISTHQSSSEQPRRKLQIAGDVRRCRPRHILHFLNRLRRIPRGHQRRPDKQDGGEQKSV